MFNICMYWDNKNKKINFRNKISYVLKASRDSAVGIATGYRPDNRGVGVPSPGRVKNFLSSTSSRPALGSTQPAIQWVLGALSPGAKRPGREVDQSPSTSAEVKKMFIYISTPPYVFMVWWHCLSTGTILPFIFYVVKTKQMNSQSSMLTLCTSSYCDVESRLVLC
jgi:hypothetical protein